MKDTNRVDNCSDELDDIFDQKPGSRLVWIIPSVVLHVVVFALWLIMPEKERVVEERKVVINQQQAEQLQEYVQDANLQELRVEVSRLQEIKQAMLEIREQEINALKDFVAEMQIDLQEDIYDSVTNIQAHVIQVLDKQKEALGSLNTISKQLPVFEEALADNNYTNMSEIASVILPERKKLSQIQKNITYNLKLLQAAIEQADSSLSWVKDMNLQRKWGDYVDMQEEVLILQVESIDKELKFNNSQIKAFEVLSKYGHSYDKMMMDWEQAETNKIEKYWTTYNSLVENTNNVTLLLAEHKLELENMREELASLKNNIVAQKNIINKKIDDDNAAEIKADAKKEYASLKNQYATLEKQIKGKKVFISKQEKLLANYKRSLSKLKYPKLGKPHYNARVVKSSMSAFDTPLPEIVGLQKDIIEKQLQAISIFDSVCADINKYLEGDK